MDRVLEDFYRRWFTEEVLVHAPGVRTASGFTPGGVERVEASVRLTSERVAGAEGGEEVVGAARICWRPDGPLPKVGDVLEAPGVFGRGRRLEVVSAGRAVSGNGLTPDHVRVVVR
ncbi:hypothetical protein C1Y63_04740 [Corynebacterium sp. 13CS0277]|uniref:hypothetical protein n=1 Tax=Corynebacterium sp. 13CS0277 TaxID=2071994 RepID=UPI000D040672|nr:hypothetical protein [Corynebacterium sp. 13CS0277]PRQ11719.1 hypothetical protein C1Y63_04740 [Corynebacterium sp. 13CS0277]